jgi:hypothetical protein
MPDPRRWRRFVEAVGVPQGDAAVLAEEQGGSEVEHLKDLGVYDPETGDRMEDYESDTLSE